MLIRYAHASLNDKERNEYLDALKIEFQADNFDLFMFEYYRKNGKNLFDL
jgi:hypothetical protein